MSNLIGQSLGRYHILEQLGEGGMATVYKAYDTRLETDVAVKVIRTEKLTEENKARALVRFEREAKSLAKLTHTNIVKVTDYGEYEGKPYLVMPYLPGGTLKQRLGKPMPWQEAVKLLLPIAGALEFAHSQNIIHRDVKPSNILITSTGEPMLSDFGIAKILDAEETRDLTGTGVGIGTPEYMAPEQGMGQADERSDIYALGIVLYEMITGRIPFRADTPLAILLKKSQESLASPKQFVPDLPQSVEDVLIKALARDPSHRYQTLGGFLGALGRLGRGRDESVTVEMPREKKNYTKWILAGIGGLVTLAVCGLVFYAITRLLSGSQTTDIEVPITQTAMDILVITEPPILTEVPVSPPAIEPLVTEQSVTGQTSIDTRDHAEIVYIPKVTFQMGLTEAQAANLRTRCEDCDAQLNASQPRHAVRIDDYWIYKTEVSNFMYQQCVQDGVCSQLSVNESDVNTDRKKYHTDPKYSNYPVSHVTWEMAEGYCNWAGGSLPTEAQWEYAARGPKGYLYPWGNQLPEPSLANVADFLPDTEPVDSYPSGASYFGLLNMTGNVWEWVYDWYQGNYYSTNTNWVNPTGPSSGDIKDGRLVRSGRGGNYWISQVSSSVALRDWDYFDRVGSAVGFRCVMPTQ
jgi:formylglycine-generating enzyme required for sulfatase activity/tRNA A-37 threonylcarbamoyl transferase component Bud32